MDILLMICIPIYIDASVIPTMLYGAEVFGYNYTA